MDDGLTEPAGQPEEVTRLSQGITIDFQAQVTVQHRNQSALSSNAD